MEPVVSFIIEAVLFLNSCMSVLEIIILVSLANNIGLATLLSEKGAWILGQACKTASVA